MTRASFLAVALLTGLALPASAQVCWRGRPRPACAAFPLLEIHGMLPVLSAQVPNPPVGSIDVFGRRMEGNVGLMWNLGPRWGVGGTVFGGGSDQGASWGGLRARVRRWVAQRYSAELIAGPLRENARGANGFTGEARLTGGDLGALFVRWNVLDVPPVRHPFDGSVVHGGGRMQALDVGGAVGSTATLAVSAGFLVWGVVALSNSNCCS